MALAALVLAAAASTLAQPQPVPKPAPHDPDPQYVSNYLRTPPGLSTPATPAWAPDGQSLAISLYGSLWLVDVATGRADQLTPGPGDDSQPTFSPDGRWLVFCTNDGSGQVVDLAAINLETEERVTLTAGDSVYLNPAFSPDGGRLAYSAALPTGAFNVFVRGFADGQFVGDAIAVTGDGLWTSDRPTVGRRDMAIEPAWLPNGQELVFLSNRNVESGSGNLVRAPAVANGGARATVVHAETTLYLTQPAVSPDGTQVVLASSRGGRSPWLNLFRVPTVGGPATALTAFTHDAFHPRWSPDGRQIVFLTNESGLPALAILETDSGRVRPVPIAYRNWFTPVGRVVIRVFRRDADGGLVPTAARVHLTASDDRAYAPPDALGRTSWSGDHGFHTAGESSLALPEGRAQLDVLKGFEFLPEHIEVDIVAEATNYVDVLVERLFDMPSEGWFAGSTGTRLGAGGPMLNDPRRLTAMAEAEGLVLVNRPPAPEVRLPFHGPVALFGVSSLPPSVTAVTPGFEGRLPTTLAPGNTTVLTSARATGAFAAYLDAFDGETDPLSNGLGRAKNFMVDAALDAVDALEWSTAGRSGFAPWYAALNSGFRITAIGGEATAANRAVGQLVGATRTYAYLGNTPLTTAAWWDAVRRGRTVVTTGPLLDLRANGQHLGETVALPAGGGDVTIHAVLRSIVPVQRVTLYFNGEPQVEVPLSSDRRSAEFHQAVSVTRSGWWHLRAEGTIADRGRLDTAYPLAFTNPIWVTVGGTPIRQRAAAEYGLKWIDMLQTMAESWPGWTDLAERRALIGEYDRARAVYRRLAAETAADRATTRALSAPATRAPASPRRAASRQ